LACLKLPDIARGPCGFAPFDPVVWDRRRFERSLALSFGHTPAAKRR
jgi:uncharacterized protein YcaQ